MAKNFEKKVSKAKRERIERIKAAEARGALPSLGFVFDISKEGTPDGGWNWICNQAERLGIRHVQQSVYVIHADDEQTEQDAQELLVEFMRILSTQPWLRKNVQNAQVISFSGMYDVTNAIKNDEAVDIKRLNTVSPIRKAFAGAYEMHAVNAGNKAIIHDTAPHFGVVFDMNCEDDCMLMESFFGSRKTCYNRIDKVMRENDLKKVQRSTYICSEIPASEAEGALKINEAIDDLRYLHGFKEVVKNIRVCEFYRAYDVTFLLKEKKMGAFKKTLRKVSSLIAK